MRISLISSLSQFHRLHPGTKRRLRAASIYGSRAASGVIIVTTKDGSNTGDKIKVTFSSSLTTQSEKPWQEPVLSSTQRGQALWQAAVNDHNVDGVTDPNTISTNAIYTYNWNNNYTSPVLNSVNIAPFVGGDSLEPAANTNWQNALYRHALITSNDIAISAGNATRGLLMDFGYYNNNGLMQFTDYQRYNARINSHVGLFDNKLKFGENFQLSRTSPGQLHQRRRRRRGGRPRHHTRTHDPLV